MSADPLRCAAAIVIAMAFLPGCPCIPPDTLFIDEFEGCSGTCDWAVSGAGSAEVAPTILEGEHGLRLSGDVTASKPIRGKVTAGSSSHAHLSFVTDCRSGLDVTITRAVNGGPPEDMVLPIALDASLTDGADLPGAKYLPFTADVGDLQQNQVALSAIKLHVAQGQVCTVDLLLLQTEQICN